MRQITIDYHQEGSSWWADSADLPGFSVVAESFSDIQAMVADAADFYLDGEAHELTERLEGGALFGLPFVAAWTDFAVRAGSGVGQASLPGGSRGPVFASAIPV
jgi:predicted RNase H-like HicB family nuclease